MVSNSDTEVETHSHGNCKCMHQFAREQYQEVWMHRDDDDDDDDDDEESILVHSLTILLAF